MKLEWITKSTEIPNGNIFLEKFDIDEYYSLLKSYQNLSNQEKQGYKGSEDFIAKNNGIVMNSSKNNYKKIIDEINKKIVLINVQAYYLSMYILIKIP